MRCLRVLALARLLHPAADIRVAGGREVHLRSLQSMALFLANSIFVNGYLTESGQPRDEALQMIADLGFELEVEGSEGYPGQGHLCRADAVSSSSPQRHL